MKLLLISERIDCSPQMINMLKNDLIHTVRKYISVNESQVTMRITQEPPVIHADIPVCPKKEQRIK
nr:cell division topological specificity factor MinE [Blautia sp. MSJ-19]